MQNDRYKLEDVYLQTVKDVLTNQWIEEQLKVLHNRVPTKEFASVVNTLHPFISDYISCLTQLRQAEILGQNMILMGVGHHNIIELGRNLYELRDLYNVDYFRSRLQDKESYDDACWELEVAINLKYSGFEVKFEKELDSKKHDLTAFLNVDLVAIECKNKHIEDKQYQRNQEFSWFFADKLLKDLEDLEENYDIRVTIEGCGDIADVKHLVKMVRKMISQNFFVRKFKDIYKIELINDYRDIPTPLVLQRSKEKVCINSSRYRSYKEGLTTGQRGTQYKDRIFFRFPDEQLQLKNVNSLLGKANKQIYGLPGCVFLKVPHYRFEESIEEIIRLLDKNRYSNLGAVKLVALNRTFVPDKGVKTERSEKLLLNDSARLPVAKPILDCLSKNIMFNKWKPYLCK